LRISFVNRTIFGSIGGEFGEGYLAVGKHRYKKTIMKHLINFFGLLFLLIAAGCAQNTDSSKIEMATSEMREQTSEQKTEEIVERKLIKVGRVEFETDNLSSTRKTIFDAVDAYKGYVSSDQEFKTPERISNTVIIRIPSDNFDNLLKDATQGVEKFESKEINVQDVTEEFLDVQARLKTKKELETRYLDILKQAKTVTEILEIEQQIGQLRSEIESIEGRLTYLQNQVSFSTLTMTFYESIPNQTEFGQKFKNGFRNGWDNLIWFFVVLTNVWPFLLFGLGLIIGIRLYRKRKH